MSTLTPPNPHEKLEPLTEPPSQEDLEALIKEARRRARLRRLAYGVAALVVAGIGGGIYAIVSSTGGGTATGTALPAGFAYVPARGPVEHVPVETRVVGQFGPQILQLATGQARPATYTDEIWYDKASKLYRGHTGIEERVQLDLVGHATCYGPKGRFCLPPGPLGELQSAPRWPLDAKRARAIGRGTFRGRSVIWVELVGVGGGGRLDWALDARSHEPIVYRTIDRLRGRRIVNEQIFTVLKDLRRGASGSPRRKASQRSSTASRRHPSSSPISARRA